MSDNTNKSSQSFSDSSGVTSFASNRKFYDDQNFPYGFNRSGDFTLSQAERLQAYGHAYQELASAKRQPQTTEEQDFVRFCLGDKQPETEHERTWNKYISLINRPRQYHSVGLHPNYVSSGFDDYPVETD